MKYLKTICFTAFFLSGLASIVYELTWIRLLRNIFGSDSLAFSSLLTIFIGGIAMGTFLSGKFIKKYFSAPANASEDLCFAIDKAKSFFFILIYGAIELTIGIYALITPLLLSEGTLGNIWIFLNKLLMQNIVLVSLAKFLVSGAVLIFPTLLLGLSYPILVELVTTNEAKVSEEYRLGSSNLYATNTLGSIFGSILGGFVLIPHFGLKSSILIATLINFFITAMLYFLNRSNGELFKDFNIRDSIAFLKKNKADQEKDIGNNPPRSFQFWLMVTIGIVLGFSNLSLEVIWNKIFALIIGSSVFSATIVISVVLAGISFGAYSLNFFSKKVKAEDFDNFLTLTITLFAFSIFLSSVFLNNCPWFFLEINQSFKNLMESDYWFFVNLTKYITVSLIIFPVTFLEGLAYAIVLYKASEITKVKNDPVGSRIAVISYWNTIGAIVGSFSAGFILIPFFSQFGSGISNSIRMILIFAFITAIMSIFLSENLDRKLCVGGLSVLALLTCIFLPGLAKNTLNSGTEIYKATKFKDISKKNFKKEHEEILFYKEGLNNIVTVVKDEAANAIFLKNDGKIEAGIPINNDHPSKADTVTQTLLGILPIAIKPDSQKALVVGMGSGKTVESLAIAGDSSELKEITVCELEKQVYKASEKFFVQDFPLKVKKKVTDARNFLNSTKEEFDLIISQPSDPWISGALFTKEFWHKAKDRLTDKGIFFQWLQLYALDEEHLNIALRTFREVFPHSYIFKPPHSAELILMGTDGLNYFNISKIDRIINSVQVRERLMRLGILDSADLLASMIMTPADFKKIPNLGRKKSKSISTDDNMSLELHTSKNIDNFHESIKRNTKYLKSLITVDNIYDLFASTEEYNFLTKLSISHNKLTNPIHQEIAEDLALAVHKWKPSPLSYLALYEIYYSKKDFEKADSLLFEAWQVYLDTVSRYHNQTVVFKNIRNNFHLDFDQNLALYKIFLRADDFKNARNIQLLLKKQILAKDLDERNILKAEIFYEKALAQKARLPVDPNLRQLSKINENLKRSRKNDYQNYKYIKEIANISALRAQHSKHDKKRYLTLALEQFKDANKLYPLDPESHLKIAELYYSRLPESRMKFMTRSDDNTKRDEVFEENLEQTLTYLKNTLELDPQSYRANYFMADLQYKMGNPDLSYIHIKRLNKLCKLESRCLAELGNENKEAFDQLSEQVLKIAKT